MKESQIDEIPGSGLTIPEERRRELLGVTSEDEISESISELPSFAGSKPRRKTESTRDDDAASGMYSRDALRKSSTTRTETTTVQEKTQLRKTVKQNDNGEVDFKTLVKLKKVKKSAGAGKEADGEEKAFPLDRNESTSSLFSNESRSRKGSIAGLKDDKSQAPNPFAQLKKTGGLEKSDSTASIKKFELKKTSANKVEEQESGFKVQLKKVVKKESSEVKTSLKERNGTDSGIDTTAFKLEKRERTKLQTYERTESQSSDDADKPKRVSIAVDEANRVTSSDFLRHPSIDVQLTLQTDSITKCVPPNQAKTEPKKSPEPAAAAPADPKAALKGRQVGKKPSIAPKEEPKNLLTQVQLKKVVKGKKEEAAEADPFKLRKVSSGIRPPGGDDDSQSESESRRGSIFGEMRRGSRAPQDGREARRRSSIDMRRESVQEIMDKVSTPLVPSGASGSAPKIVEVPENVTVVENETAILTCKVTGSPAPTFKWFKGNREVINGGRFKHITDGEAGTVSLAMLKCRSQDDGPYTLTVENANGTDTAVVKLLVTAEDGLDFRSMLKHRYENKRIEYIPVHGRC
ncbi:unnamed protein product [Caenorhabditis auriculariae]|uniref:Ig-like domain-containing protein n=1 Tax=Caenorhabditis auriculariae TaxID=2777116 RepID=A0A8S1HVJ6_9PELO|nr:unnamed protein product [Caenorhabditis auriculariae]